MLLKLLPIIITAGNVIHCKKVLELVNELHHVEGIKGNFYLSETEYIAPATFPVKGKPALILFNVKEIMEFHQRHIFESFGTGLHQQNSEYMR